MDHILLSHADFPVYRVIPSRYPKIDLYEKVASFEEWELLHEIESLTNPRLRDEVGDIRLVRQEDRVFGEGASWIMAAFTHPPADGRGGRFNRDFGIYYCSPEEKVCVAETLYHQERFLRESRVEKEVVQMRLLGAKLGPVEMHDIRQLPEKAGASLAYDPDDYSYGQQLGEMLRAAGSYGLRYRSVRSEQGECVAVMRPSALSQARHVRYLQYNYRAGALTVSRA